MELFAATSAERSNRSHIGLLAAISATRFINLGFADLQAWDEALYAMRSLAVIRYGAVFDQTAYAVDGLYSSLHPPLYVWLTGLCLAIFGQSEFVFRFCSAVFGAATLFVLYALGKKLSDARTGLFAALLFGLNPFVSFFSRQGQFDTVLTFFLTLALLFLCRAIETDDSLQYLYAGLSIGAALMTKLFVGLGILVSFGLWGLFHRRHTTPGFREAFLVLAGGACIALPWHVYMTIVHGDGNPLFFLTRSAIWERTFYGIEGNLKPTGPFYFVNQMVVVFPLGVAFFVSGLLRMKTEPDQRWMLMYLWFVVLFGVFTLMRTKLAVYLLPMLVPASLIAGRELRLFLQGHLSSNRGRVLLIGTAIALIWSSSQDLRNAVKDGLVVMFHLALPGSDTIRFLLLLTVLCLLAVAAILFFFRWNRMRLFRQMPAVMFIPAAVWLLYVVSVRDRMEYKDGAMEVREFIARIDRPKIVVAGFERNPQLTYYLDGADIGWRNDIRMRRILPPFRREEYRTWLHEEMFQEPPETILIIEKDKLIRYEVLDPAPFVPDGLQLVLDTRRYACYQRQPSALFASNGGAH